MKNNWTYKTPGIPDDMFIRGKVPMTKEEIRSITIGKLRLNEEDIVVDIGAGTGALSIESALMARQGKVYAIEKNPEGVYLIKENIKKFNIDNIEVIKGIAPKDLDKVPEINRAIVGGTGGRIEEVFDWLDTKLMHKGRIVLNAITIETTYRAIENLKRRKYEDIDVTQASISKGKSIGSLTMMQGQNPIYIISGAKG